MTDDRVLFEVDSDKRIATITLNNPGQRNSYDAAMRDTVARYLDRVAEDDDITVVLLRGAEGVFSTGADMNNAYGWYGDKDAPEATRRPSQRRRLTVDRKSFGFYHNLMGFPKVTVGEINGYALGGGFEMALMTDISVIGRDQKGIVARISTYLAGQNINIEDIEQRIVEGLFIMSMRVDLTDVSTTLDEVILGLKAISAEIGVEVTLRLSGGRERKRFAILVTKEPQCLEALIRDQRAGKLNGDPVVVLSNHEVLRPVAEAAGMPFFWKDAEDKAAH